MPKFISTRAGAHTARAGRAIATSLVIGTVLAAAGVVSAAWGAVGPGGHSVSTAAYTRTPDADGLWLTSQWSLPRVVNHVFLSSTAASAQRVPQSIVSFSDGSSVMVTPDARGDVDVSISPRTVTSASVRVVDNSSPRLISVDGFSFDHAGSSIGRGGGIAQSSSGTTAALADGNVAGGATGAVWQSAPGDPAPWAGIRYASPREVDAVQLFGAPAGGAASWGDLVFSDGSSVRVTSVDGAGGQPTTIAFTPRVTTSVRYVPQSTGVLTLRELVIGERGVTLPRLPVSGASYTVATPSRDSSCGLSSTAVGSVAAGGLALVCPATGSTVTGTAQAVVIGPAGATVRASAWIPTGSKDSDGAIGTVGTAVVPASGRTAITFDASKLEHGPFAVRVTVDGSPATGDRLLYVQLYNAGGITVTSPGFAPSGMTLAWADDFSQGVAASVTGQGTVYGALQPQPGGAGQFGSAIFADPAKGAGTIGTLASSTLRLRAMPFTGSDSTGWGRTMQSGLLSSAHSDGSGTLAQYGYFETRALGAPGRGSWPAFWMQSAESAVASAPTFSEVDAEELYGHNPIYGCQSAMLWTRGSSTHAGGPSCTQFGAGDGYSTDDWALRWHSYGVKIEPSDIKYYIDGRLVKERNDVPTSSQPYYFMLDEALGGGYAVQLQQTGNVTDFYVDWVRVYS